jgi:hypothetical protein
MQKITLSDHTADMVQQAEQQRATENAARQAAYEKSCQQSELQNSRQVEWMLV